MTRIHVGTLGGLRIVRAGEEVHALSQQPVRCALFLYLALERGATRDELLALLWPERDPERARHSLRQTLYELRRTLGEDWSRTQGERIQVSSGVEIDALTFLQAVDEARDEEALVLYHGPFLQGSHPGTTPAFESWTAAWRSRLARRHRELCRRLSESRATSGDGAGALAVARRWVEADPLDDEGQHRLISLLAEGGRRSEALRQYEVFEELIGRELDVEPLDETKELVERIRAGDAALPEGTGAARAPPDAPYEGTAPPPPPASDARAEVSREPAWTRVRTAGLVAASALAGVLLLALLLRPGGDPSDPSLAVEPQPTPSSIGIAVLPFENWSPNPEQEYFSDGITEDVLTALSRIQDLRVISRTSVMRYKQTTLTSPEIADELGVDHLLEGTVRREGDVVRITAQLIDARADAHLWADAYDREVREVADVFAVQTEIAERIADALQRRLLPGALEGLAAGETPHPDAYDLFLRGREYLNRPGAGDLRKYPLAMDFFSRALEIDPEYARAWAGVAETFRRHVALPAVPVRRDSILYYAERAMELAPELPEAATELGFGHLFAGELEAAGSAFRRALAADPNQADAMDGMTRLSALEGRLDDAVRWQRRVVEVDPFSTQSLSRLGSYLFDLGDLDGAEASFERAVQLAPDHPEAGYLRAQVHLLRGEHSEADARMAALMAAAGDHPGALFAMAQFEADRGRYREAERFLEQSPVGDSPAGKTFLALLAHRLGETDRARAHLREPDELIRSWEAAGIAVPPHALLVREVLLGTPEGVLTVIRTHWRQGLRWVEDPPRIGIYWLDRDPVVRDLSEDPRFTALMSEIRRELDDLRAALADA